MIVDLRNRFKPIQNGKIYSIGNRQSSMRKGEAMDQAQMIEIEPESEIAPKPATDSLARIRRHGKCLHPMWHLHRFLS